MERDVVDDLARSLPVSRRRRRAIQRELRSHLEEACLELERAGWSPDDARQESLARLGNREEIAEAFGQVYRPRRRKQFGLAVGLAGALLLGVYGGGTLASATSAHKATVHTQHAKVTKTVHHCRTPAS